MRPWFHDAVASGTNLRYDAVVLKKETDMIRDSTSTVELLRHAFGLLNSGDIDACYELLTPDFIANYPGAPEPTIGRDAWKENVTMFRLAFPDLHVEIDDIFGSGDRAAVRLTFTGTHQGEFFGMPATGRAVTFTSVELYRSEGGRMAEEWVSPDIATLMRQISAAES
jgi:steroid delta-isomerase-like uncharacterized protein